MEKFLKYSGKLAGKLHEFNMIYHNRRKCLYGSVVLYIAELKKGYARTRIGEISYRYTLREKKQTNFKLTNTNASSTELIWNTLHYMMFWETYKIWNTSYMGIQQGAQQ